MFFEPKINYISFIVQAKFRIETILLLLEKHSCVKFRKPSGNYEEIENLGLVLKILKPENAQK